MYFVNLGIILCEPLWFDLFFTTKENIVLVILMNNKN
jgi:hypothetical protein